MSIPIEDRLPAPPPRPDEGHKGTFGKALIVAGSRGMSGAACLAGLGALRGGAGLVQVAVPAGILPVVAGVEPSFLTAPLPEDGAGRFSRQAQKELLSMAGGASATAIGPGWGASSDLVELAHAMFTGLAGPLVIDADGLNALAKSSGGWPRAPGGAPRVITPHPGEFARLVGMTASEVQSNRETLAAEFAAQNCLVVLLKGHRTIITDGQRLAINTTGNSGMATGGTGDVLTGLVTALLAQGMVPFDAARLAAHLHGLAGDLAARELSRPGLIASDLPHYLAKAWLELGTG